MHSTDYPWLSTRRPVNSAVSKRLSVSTRRGASESGRSKSSRTYNATYRGEAVFRAAPRRYTRASLEGTAEREGGRRREEEKKGMVATRGYRAKRVKTGRGEQRTG